MRELTLPLDKDSQWATSVHFSRMWSFSAIVVVEWKVETVFISFDNAGWGLECKLEVTFGETFIEIL